MSCFFACSSCIPRHMLAFDNSPMRHSGILITSLSRSCWPFTLMRRVVSYETPFSHFLLLLEQISGTIVSVIKAGGGNSGEAACIYSRGSTARFVRDERRRSPRSYGIRTVSRWTSRSPPFPTLMLSQMRWRSNFINPA
jgi:hypothetical protein